MRVANRRIEPATDGKTSRRGFTLVEILVATILLTIAATALAGYTGYIAKVRLLNKRQSIALVAAQEAIENVRSHRFPDVPLGQTQETTVIGKTSLIVITNVTAVGTNMKTVEVSVRTTGNGQLQFLRTIVFKEII